MRLLDQWVVWRLVERDGRPTKVPYDQFGNRARTNDPATWTDFDTALQALRGGGFSGLGFMLGEDDGLVGVDLDHCRDPETGEVAPWAQSVIDTLNTYTELSPSGTGLHLWIRGAIPRGRKLTKPHGIEVYDATRFLTVTGACVHRPGELAEPGPTLADWYAATFPLPESVVGRGSVKSSPELTDEEVLALALGASNGDRVRELLDLDPSAHDDPSGADLALVSLFSFYTQNPAQLEALWARSKLAGRAKWQRADYRDRTIAFALSSLRATFSGRVVERELTDVGNAYRMRNLYGEQLRWNQTTGEWLLWSGTHWRTDDRNRVLGMAQDTALSIYDELKGLDPESSLHKQVYLHARNSQAVNRCNAMLAQLKALPGVTVLNRDLDTDPWLLNCPNGTLDLRTGVLQPHDPGALLTRITAAAYVPGARSVVWERYLDGVFLQHRGEMLSFLQRLAGYTLTGLTVEEVVVLLLGGAGSGKTTFLEAFGKTLGDYAKSAASESFLHDKYRTGAAASPDMAELDGARFVRTVEPDKGRRFDASRLKSVAGGDEQTARFLYRNQFHFNPQYTLWFAANAAPEADADDEGLWRRLLRVPFEHARPEHNGQRDPSIKAALLNPAVSGEAILAWAVEGCLAWQRGGLGIPEFVLRRTRELREEMDVTEAFFEEFCEFVPNDQTVWTKAADLWEAYTGFTSGEGRKPLSRGEFAKKLEAKGATKGRTKAEGRVWHGVRTAGAGLFPAEQHTKPVSKYGVLPPQGTRGPAA